MSKKLFSLLVVAATFSPVVVLAANTLQGILEVIKDMLNTIVPMLITLALIYFFWGLALYIKEAGNDADRKKAIAIMLNGVLALFVMVSVWGLVNLLSQTFLTGVSNTITVPQVPTY
jgi:membrane protease YdiL (CAAX protease family)